MAKIRRSVLQSLSSSCFVLLFIECLVLVSTNNAALAQNPDSSQTQEQLTPFVLPPQKPLPLPIPSPEPTDPLEIAPTTIPNSQELPELSQSIIVSKFEFEDNTAFSDEELAKILAPFTNKPLVFSQLLQAEAAITQLYVSSGYINSGAVIPVGQTLNANDAIVKIQIVEGGLEEVNVQVEGQLNASYIKDRLANVTNQPLNQKRLLEALQLLQLNPLIENIAADLSAGTRPQASILTIKVKEADPFKIELFTNNTRVPSVSSLERGISLKHANLLGFGDGLNIEYSNTSGSNAVNTNYAIPINSSNGTIKLTSRWSNTEIVEEPFDRIDITGESLYLDLSWRQPIIQTPSQELAVGIVASRQTSQTKISGVGSPLSPGANDRGETRLWALRLFQEWTERSSQDIFSLRSQFSIGLDVFDTTINSGSLNGSFFQWQGQGQYVRSLGLDTLLILRSSLQLATQPLVPLEQFTLGGLYSIRGYRQDLFLADNGLTTSAELRLPILRVNRVEGLLQLSPFVDFGIIWNDRENPTKISDSNALVSLGLGLQWQMGSSFTASLDWGIPLVDINSSDRTLQEQGIYFTTNYSFF